MKYTSKSALKAALLNAITEAVDAVTDEVLEEVDDAVMHYYKAYSPGSATENKCPWEYDRTGLLSHAPKRNGIQSSGNGAAANVYMDTGLQYNTGSWDMEHVIKAADLYTHGGWNIGEGVSIWHDPMEEVKNKSRKMWQKALKDAGLKIE